MKITFWEKGAVKISVFGSGLPHVETVTVSAGTDIEIIKNKQVFISRPGRAGLQIGLEPDEKVKLEIEV